jgi:hypothetical protein
MTVEPHLSVRDGAAARPVVDDFPTRFQFTLDPATPVIAQRGVTIAQATVRIDPAHDVGDGFL